MKHDLRIQLKPRSQGFNLLSDADKKWLILALSDTTKKTLDVVEAAKARNIKLSKSALSRFYRRFEREIVEARANTLANQPLRQSASPAVPMVSIQNKDGRIVFNLTFSTPLQPPVDIFIDGQKTLSIEAQPKQQG